MKTVKHTILLHIQNEPRSTSHDHKYAYTHEMSEANVFFSLSLLLRSLQPIAGNTKTYLFLLISFLALKQTQTVFKMDRWMLEMEKKTATKEDLQKKSTATIRTRPKRIHIEIETLI